MQKVDALIDAPRQYLRTTGLPRAFVNSISIPSNTPTVIAQSIVNKLDEHGRLEEPPYKTALGAFLEYLLESSLGKDDKDFIRNILVEQNLICLPRPANQEGLESIVKERMQEWWRSASFLTIGAQRLRAVCRVETNEKALGTGFLVAPDLVLTCCHVVRDVPEDVSLEDKAKRLKFRFGYLKEIGQIFPGEEVEARQTSEALLEHSEVAALDFALIRLSKPIEEQFGVLPLLKRASVRGEEVIILQHPVGKDMQLMLGRVNLVSDRRIRHDVNTLPGSSGSPIFDENWDVIGLHRSGTEYGNEGVPMAKIAPLIRM